MYVSLYIYLFLKVFSDISKVLNNNALMNGGNATPLQYHYSIFKQR